MFPQTIADVIEEFNHHVWARGLQQIIEGTFGKKIFEFDTVVMTVENICLRIFIKIQKADKSLRLASTEQNVKVWLNNDWEIPKKDEVEEIIMSLVKEWQKIPLPEFTEHIKLIKTE